MQRERRVAPDCVIRKSSESRPRDVGHVMRVASESLPVFHMTSASHRRAEFNPVHASCVAHCVVCVTIS